MRTKPSLNRKSKRPAQKDARPISGMINDTLKRHGIKSQIQSAMTVKEANLILDQLVDSEFRSDLRVLSFVHGSLTIACRHSPASHLAHNIRLDLQENLETKIPNLDIKQIYIRIDPHALESGSEIH